MKQKMTVRFKKKQQTVTMDFHDGEPVIEAQLTLTETLSRIKRAIDEGYQVDFLYPGGEPKAWA